MLFFAAIIAATTYFGTNFWNKSHNGETEANTDAYYCNYNIKRMAGYKFVRPILWVDEDCESQSLAATKHEVSEIIERYKKFEGVEKASIYLRKKNAWTVVNENDKYEPGSLFKVPIMITILKMEEDTPGFLNKRLLFDKPFPINKALTYPSKSIKLGQSYTVRELLEYMIKYSDNNATQLLETQMSTKTIQKLFADVGVEVPNAYATQYLFTARDYSLFMRTIFNAGYLTINNSEYAAELLTQSEFKDGIAKGLPSDVKMAHKFGEAGSPIDKQLHESAIVYLDGGGYLLTIMTKGKDIKKLSELIGEISAIVYKNVKNSDE